MAESSSFYLELPDSDPDNLKESLCAKQLLLQKVYSELDEEREASSTAANEAMSMILRLQGEKAQLKMEASQYKREAEEKMCLAEESLAIFEDLLYQKEMEIACLEYQVQAYRYKLSDMGCSDLDIPEYKLPDRSDPFLSEIGSMRSNVRRHDSLPSLAIKDNFPKRSSVERDRSPFLMSDFNPRSEITNSDQEMNFLLDSERSTYWERIRKLDEQMKEISDGKIPRRRNFTSSRNRLRSCSVPPPDVEDSSLSSSPTLDSTATRCDPMKNSKNLVEKKAVLNAASSSSMESQENRRYRKPVAEENVESQIKNKVPPFPKNKDKGNKQRERMSAERQLSLPLTANCPLDYQVEIERLSQRIWRLENKEKESNTSQEISVEGGAGMVMLKELFGQLNTLQSELRKYTTKKSSYLDEQGLQFLREAMVYFWL